MSSPHLTFELYLTSDAGRPVFEAFTCRSRAELMPAVRRLIAERDLRSIDVREMGVPLFTVGR